MQSRSGSGLERLPGEPLEAGWSSVGAEDRGRIVRTLGAALAALHALPVPRDVPPVVAIDWPAFVATQTATAGERQRALGLPEPLCAALPDAIGGAALDPHTIGVLVQADMNSNNLLLAGAEASGWSDFGDAMIGDPLYDLVTPGVFVCKGERVLVDALLDGYGLPPARRDAVLRRRLFAWTALHRFAHLGKYLRWAGRPNPATLEEAELALWPIG